MIQITTSGVTIAPHAIHKLGRELAETGCAVLPEFFSPPILQKLLRQVDQAKFETRNEVSLANVVFGTTQFVPPTEALMKTLHFVLNQDPLFKTIETAAGCAPVLSFAGRVHRTRGGSGEKIDWHNDAADHRLVGLNINLGTQAFSGGLFQIRGPGNRERDMRHTRAGDAFLFQIERDWKHRLTPVESGERTVAVGWFRAERN